MISSGRTTPSLLAALALLLPCGGALAGEVEMRMSGMDYSMPVTSLEEARFRSVVKQKYDFSCGSAALATVLTHHYGLDTPERQVFEAMWEVGDKEKIAQVGFSMLDMKRYLAGRGFRSDGFRLSLNKLEQVRVPAITLLDIDGYKHFVVVTGIEHGRVLVADPSRGQRAIRRRDFEQMWNGILFMIRDDLVVGQASFNDPEDWASNPEAPTGPALSLESLGNFTIGLPGASEF